MMPAIADLKARGEDFEFYPTTNEIIRDLIRDIESPKGGGKYWGPFRGSSILDIGAGNGKVLRAVTAAHGRLTPYAIEKSQVLREALPSDVFVIGTDFLQQSLFDKKIDITYCNPPYSEFEAWAKKIIRESTSYGVYLLLPRRWAENPIIAEAVSFRDAKTTVIGEYSFENAEDRQARAIVNLIRVDLRENKEDAFDRIFDEEFSHLKAKFQESEEGDAKGDGGKFSHIVTGENYVAALVEMYRQELKAMHENYARVGELDPALFKEFGISVDGIRKCLREKLQGLKNLYWHELTGRMEEITSRLISKRRDKLLQKLNENGNVDFTPENIYSTVLWIIKNASEHIDGQLIDTYDRLISKANCRNYKSNQRVFEYDRWRYNAEKPSHIYLDYRLVLSIYNAIEADWAGNTYSIADSAGEYLGDLLTVAYNLGFECDTRDERLWRYSSKKYWQPGQPQEFYCRYKGKEIVLFEAKLHKNGNIHLRLNQQFALALNVEYGRLKGWIHSKKEAAEEIKDPKAAEFFRTNLSLLEMRPAFLALPDDTKCEEHTPAESEQVELFSLAS